MRSEIVMKKAQRIASGLFLQRSASARAARLGKKIAVRNMLTADVVPVTGVEPVRYRYHWILSPARLPIPSHRHGNLYYYIVMQTKLQAQASLFF